MSQPGSADDGIFARWLALLLSCFGQTQRSGSVAVTSGGVEREMKLSHHQPHLVPPMKLVFYDEMPNSPLPRPGSAKRMSHWLSQGKEFATKASDRASLTIKKKLSRPNISAPLPVTTRDRISSHGQQFSALQLSIYLPGNRLSDLPEFEHVAFTDLGEIQVPPKALVRTRSEDMLQSFSKPSTTRPATSMVGERQLDYWQQRSSSLGSEQPRRVFEGLSSHPVYWSSFSGISPQNGATHKALSPTAEEEEEEPSPVLPQIDAQQQDQPPTPALPPPTIQLPHKQAVPTTTTTTSPSSSNRLRISHWLSLSHPKPTTQPPSQFYQCAITPPLPPHHHHHRPSSFTSSPPPSPSRYYSNIPSPTTSPTTSDTDSLVSMTSSTTAPTTVLDATSWSKGRSRSATVRTLDSGAGSAGEKGRVSVRVREEESDALPLIPDLYVCAKLGRGEEDVAVVGEVAYGVAL